MANIGVPMSADDYIDKTVKGITYKLRPPIGKTEKDMRRIQRSTFNLAPYYEAAEKKVDSKHKGKKWGPGERMDAITTVAAEMAESEFLKNYNPEENEDRTREVFDLICVSWSGGAENKKAKKSDQVPYFVQEYICTWYLDQMKLSEDDRKN